MIKFNPLNHPILLSHPLLPEPTDRVAYAPLAMALIDLLRPSVFVELGTANGFLYCSFCQAVRDLLLDCRCFRVSPEDQHDNSDGQKAFADMKEHHDDFYHGFSRLIQSNFDSALPQFEEKSIDLLHLEHARSYEAAKQIIGAWLPKMSDRGVIILGNTNLYDAGFDVWKLWKEITARHPHFEFAQQGGLGVFAVGPNVPAGLQPLLAASDGEASLIREFFRQLGERLGSRLQNSPLDDGLQSRVKDLSLELQGKKDELAEKESTVKTLIEELGLAEKEAEKARWDANQFSAGMNQMSVRISYLSDKESRLNDILNSRAWRWVCHYGRFKNRFITPAYRLIKPAPAEEISTKPTSTDEYRKWIDEYDTLSDSDRQAIRARIEAFKNQPLMSVIMPVYDVDEKWLRAAIESVRRQLYSNWELCIADDASHKPHVRATLEEYMAKDPRIKVVFRNQN
ncbi:MAG: hypothetical protein QOI77_2143, partial [Blastocatellia bacterium]|nr:hypothetical protein [Blastocatellia bacterium]